MATYYGKKYKMLETRHLFKELLLSAKIALKSKETGKPNTKQPVYIAMIDGETFHGGMCDRFKGIVSLYAYCKYTGNPFRIRYTYPFRLEDYLQPAAYDWTLKQGEYTDNPLYSRVLYMRGEHLATRLLGFKAKKQVHFYSNRDMVAILTRHTLRKAERPLRQAGESFIASCSNRERFSKNVLTRQRRASAATITLRCSASKTCLATSTSTTTRHWATRKRRKN